MAGLRIAYAFYYRGHRCHYKGVLLDSDGRRVWKCEHRHPASRKSPAPGPVDGSAVFTSAIDCARGELARRAEEAVAMR